MVKDRPERTDDQVLDIFRRDARDGASIVLAAWMWTAAFSSPGWISANAPRRALKAQKSSAHRSPMRGRTTAEQATASAGAPERPTEEATDKTANELAEIPETTPSPQDHDDRRNEESSVAPAIAPQVAAIAHAAPSPTTAAHQEGVSEQAARVALSKWQTKVAAAIERRKVYPAAAKARRETGIALVAFTINRSGALAHARIARSSGSVHLDGAAIEIIRKAAPLPPPPNGFGGDTISLTVPLRFNIR